jgi:hypothetical protein
MRPPAQERLERMRVGIERWESVEAQQGRKNQGLTAAPTRLLPVMP